MSRKDGGGNTIIGKGSVVEGVMDIEHQLQVDGQLRGRLTTPKRLVVGEEGAIVADSIEVGEAVINGRVMARLKANEQVYLSASARFRGTLLTPRLVIEEGAEATYSNEIPVRAIPFGSETKSPPVHTTVAEFPAEEAREAASRKSDAANRQSSGKRKGNSARTPEGEIAGGD